MSAPVAGRRRGLVAASNVPPPTSSLATQDDGPSWLLGDDAPTNTNTNANTSIGAVVADAPRANTNTLSFLDDSDDDAPAAPPPRAATTSSPQPPPQPTSSATPAFLWDDAPPPPTTTSAPSASAPIINTTQAAAPAAVVDRTGALVRQRDQLQHECQQLDEQLQTIQARVRTLEDGTHPIMVEVEALDAAMKVKQSTLDEAEKLQQQQQQSNTTSKGEDDVGAGDGATPLPQEQQVLLDAHRLELEASYQATLQTARDNLHQQQQQLTATQARWEAIKEEMFASSHDALALAEADVVKMMRQTQIDLAHHVHTAVPKCIRECMAEAGQQRFDVQQADRQHRFDALHHHQAEREASRQDFVEKRRECIRHRADDVLARLRVQMSKDAELRLDETRQRLAAYRVEAQQHHVEAHRVAQESLMREVALAQENLARHDHLHHEEERHLHKRRAEELHVFQQRAAHERRTLASTHTAKYMSAEAENKEPQALSDAVVKRLHDGAESLLTRLRRLKIGVETNADVLRRTSSSSSSAATPSAYTTFAATNARRAAMKTSAERISRQVSEVVAARMALGSVGREMEQRVAELAKRVGTQRAKVDGLRASGAVARRQWERDVREQLSRTFTTNPNNVDVGVAGLPVLRDVEHEVVESLMARLATLHQHHQHTQRVRHLFSEHVVQEVDRLGVQRRSLLQSMEAVMAQSEMLRRMHGEVEGRRVAAEMAESEIQEEEKMLAREVEVVEQLRQALDVATAKAERRTWKMRATQHYPHHHHHLHNHAPLVDLSPQELNLRHAKRSPARKSANMHVRGRGANNAALIAELRGLIAQLDAGGRGGVDDDDDVVRPKRQKEVVVMMEDGGTPYRHTSPPLGSAMSGTTTDFSTSLIRIPMPDEESGTFPPMVAVNGTKMEQHVLPAPATATTPTTTTSANMPTTTMMMASATPAERGEGAEVSCTSLTLGGAAMTKEVNDQNFLLVKDKIILARDMESARRRRSVLEVENTELRRKIALSTGTEKELLQRSVKQKREVSKLKEQVKTTEDGLNSIVEEYEQRLAKLRADHEKSIKALTVERDDARNDAKKLLVELKRLRELSGQLVLQHSELEQFFYDALRTVRCEIVQERRRQIVGMPCSVGPSASQTASSTLRLQTQPRLMLTETANSTALPRLHQWGRDGKGLPVLLSNSSNNKKKQKRTSKSVDSLGTLIKTNHSQLPYLHYDGDDHDEAHSRDEDPDAMNVEEEAEFFDDTAAAPSLRHIPDAPTMAQIQRVDIASMSWTEKERVIRYLFKRLQQQTHRRPAPADGGSDSTTTQDEAEMKMPPSGLVMRDSDTFLTQP